MGVSTQSTWECVVCVQGYNMRIHHAFLLILLVCQFGLGFTGKAKKDKDAEPEEPAADAEGSAAEEASGEAAEDASGEAPEEASGDGAEEVPAEGAADPAGDHCIKALEALIADLKGKEGGADEGSGEAEGSAAEEGDKEEKPEEKDEKPEE